jgi:hypothetical protein
MREHRDEIVGKAVMSLPTPPASDDFFASVHQAIGGAPPHGGRHDNRASRWPRFRVHEGGWRRLALAGTVLVVTLAVGGVVGAVFASPSNGAPPTPVTSFQPALGWNTFETNVLADPTQPEVLWAANVPFKAESMQTPQNTLANLPSNGIVIVVVGPFPYAGTETLPTISLPLTVSDLQFSSDSYEGQPAPNVSRYYTWAHVNATDVVDVYVWMGTNQPTQSMINDANTELARMSLPPS